MLLALEKGTCRRGRADVRRPNHLSAAGRSRGSTRRAPTSICRRSICRSRGPASSSIHSPRFRVELQPGTFRVEADPGVFAEALRASGTLAVRRTGRAAQAPPPSAPAARRHRRARAPGEQTQFQMLIDRYRNEGGGRTVKGALPVEVAFPSMGPSLFMASELTAESQAPSIDLTMRRSGRCIMTMLIFRPPRSLFLLTAHDAVAQQNHSVPP